MKVRYRGTGTKRYQYCGTIIEIPSDEWLEIHDLNLFLDLKRHRSVFDSVVFCDLKPFEIVSKHLYFEGCLIFTTYGPAVARLKKIPFVRLQAVKPEISQYIFKITKYSDNNLSSFSNVGRAVNALVMRTLGGIGDIVMTSPVVEVAKKRYPHYNITYSCPAEFIDVISNNPFAKSVPIQALDNSEDWDTVLDLARDCIKYEIDKQPNVERNRCDVFIEAAGLGIETNVRPKFYLSDEEIEKARKELEHYGRKLKIGVVLDSNAPVRRWSNMSSFREQITAEYPDALILEIKVDKPRRWSESPNVYPVFGRTIREVAALINECDVVISPDTGPAHISSALRVPTIWIFTHIDGSIRTKNYDNCWVVKSDYSGCPIKQPCWYLIPCSTKDNRLEETENPWCSRAISVEQVMLKLKEVLSVPNVSYCVVYHNKPLITRQCIDAIVDHSKYNDEIVIVDNGSVDAFDYTGDNIKRLRIDDNKGCVIGRNLAMRNATGRFLLTLDNDQFISHHTIHRLMRVEADIVGVEAWSMDQDGFAYDIADNRGQLSYVGAGGMLVKKSVAEKIGYFTEEYAPAWFEDPDFCNKAKKNGYSIGYEIDAGIDHLGHQTISAQKTFDQHEAWKNSHELYQRKWGRIAILSSKPSVALIVDVMGWAWDYKSKQLAKYLSNEFDVQILYHNRGGKVNCDIALAYDCENRYFDIVSSIKKITGVTAHVYTNFRNYESVLTSSDAIHANSMMLFDEIKKYNNNCHYVPNGVDEDLFSVQPMPTGEFTIGFVGKQTVRKGFDEYIVPACSAAGVKLVSATAKYNDDNKIDHSHMPEFYKSVHAIIIASDMDGTPNQLLEAAAVGRPCIANMIGNVPEFVNDGVNGLLVKERTVSEYVKKINQIKNRTDLCEQLGLEARKTVESAWTWKIQSNNYRRMFRDVSNNC